MKTRQLGNSGLQVGSLAFGGNVFGWTADEPTSFKLLVAFVAAGCNLIDTADVYSRWAPGHQGGESETILGHWLRRSGKRGQVVIATKVGMEMGPTEKGLSRTYILRAAAGSLQRLQTDCIDLYQSHTDDETTPLEETLGALADLIKQGKVRAIGASNYTAERLTQALRVSKENALPRYECLQPLYNLSDRAPFEGAIEPLCVKEGLGVITSTTAAAHPRGSRFRRGTVWIDPGPRGSRLADGPPERDGANRQRDEPRPAHRPHRSDPAIGRVSPAGKGKANVEETDNHGGTNHRARAPARGKDLSLRVAARARHPDPSDR